MLVQGVQAQKVGQVDLLHAGLWWLDWWICPLPALDVRAAAV